MDIYSEKIILLTVYYVILHLTTWRMDLHSVLYPEQHVASPLGLLLLHAITSPSIFCPSISDCSRWSRHTWRQNTHPNVSRECLCKQIPTISSPIGHQMSKFIMQMRPICIRYARFFMQPLNISVELHPPNDGLIGVCPNNAWSNSLCTICVWTSIPRKSEWDNARCLALRSDMGIPVMQCKRFK